MTQITISSTEMTYANKLHPTRTHGTLYRSALRQSPGGGADECQIFLKFSLPGPAGSLFTSAEVQIHSQYDVPSRTYAIRPVKALYTSSRVNWNNRPVPDPAYPEIRVTTALKRKDPLRFDVTGVLNQMRLSKKPFYGFIIYFPNEVTDSTARWFYTDVQASVNYPKFFADYSTAPRIPTDLLPSEGRAISLEKPTLSGTFHDVSGDTRMKALQARVYVPGQAEPEWDSGEYATQYPFIDLATTDYPGVPLNATRQWDLRFMDGDNLWSPWAEKRTFVRKEKGVVSILQPGASPNNFVEDATPTVSHFFSKTQRDLQYVIWNSNKTAVVSDTGRLTTDETGYAVPAQKGLVAGQEYVLEARVWDNVARASTPGDPAYASAERRFKYTPTATITGTTDLVVTQPDLSPDALLTWKRTTYPDFFDVFRDGRLIASELEPEDVAVSPGALTFSWLDGQASPRSDHTWEVRAKVNGRNSAGNKKTVAQIKPTTAFLTSVDREIRVPFLNYSSSVGRVDGSNVVQVLNSDEPITVYQGTSGRMGEFEGIVSGGLGSDTAKGYLDQVLSLDEEENHGRPCILTWADQAVPCVVSKVKYTPSVMTEEIVYVVSFYVTEKKVVS